MKKYDSDLSVEDIERQMQERDQRVSDALMETLEDLDSVIVDLRSQLESLAGERERVVSYALEGNWLNLSVYGVISDEDCDSLYEHGPTEDIFDFIFEE